MGSKNSFGQLLRFYRRRGHDPRRGGLLTQERLGELLGNELGHAGYSGAAVSDWERDKSKIDEEDWFVLLALVTVLHRSGGLKSAAMAGRAEHTASAANTSWRITMTPKIG